MGILKIPDKGIGDIMGCPYCNENKSTERSEEEKKNLLNRLSRIEGQIKGIKSMIETDRYCVDILMQSSAVSKAFLSLEREILSQHLRTCVARDIKEGKEEIFDETMTVIERLMR